MTATQVVFVLGVLTLTAVAAVLDARWKRLPNALNVTALVLGLLFNVVHGATNGVVDGASKGWLGAGQGLLFGLAGFAIGFGTLLILWLIGGGGGGDAKFMGALGAWLGPVLTVEVLIAATVLAAVFSVTIYVRDFFRVGISRAKRQQRAASAAIHKAGSNRGADLSRKRRTNKRYVPFGVPAALATWVLVVSAWIIKWPKLPM